MTNIHIYFTNETELDLSLYKLKENKEDQYIFEWGNYMPYTSEYSKKVVVFKNKINYITCDD